MRKPDVVLKELGTRLHRSRTAEIIGVRTCHKCLRAFTDPTGTKSLRQSWLIAG